MRGYPRTLFLLQENFPYFEGILTKQVHKSVDIHAPLKIISAGQRFVQHFHQIVAIKVQQQIVLGCPTVQVFRNTQTDLARCEPVCSKKLTKRRSEALKRSSKFLSCQNTKRFQGLINVQYE